MANQKDESVQRWTAKRRSALVMSILKGETSTQEAARKHGLTVAEIESWKERFLLGAENALRSRPKDEEALKDEEIKKLQRKLGEMVLDALSGLTWQRVFEVVREQLLDRIMLITAWLGISCHDLTPYASASSCAVPCAPCEALISQYLLADP